MALTLETVNLVKQRTRWEVRKQGAMAALKALWLGLQQNGNPDLQYVALDYTGNADQVIADVPCRLYAIYVKKPAASTVAAWLKFSDHATVAAASGDIVIPLIADVAAGKEFALVFPDGLPLAVGLTTASHTTVDGNTDSADADSAAGFAIVGAY